MSSPESGGSVGVGESVAGRSGRSESGATPRGDLGGRTIGIVAGVVAAVAGVLAVVVMLFDGSEDGTRQTCGNVAGDGNELVCQLGVSLQEAGAMSDAELEAEAYDADPQDVIPGGPWPFIVYRTESVGLKVRSSAVKDGVTVGAIVDRGTAWVECRTTTSFNPDPALGTGPMWYRVRWPSDEATNEYLESEPAAVHTGWIYAGYTDPVGHNGEVPECDE
ncbi:MAG: hypothetical protein S0880_10720 [Actinomycetota bacterium]|nr:hypothetical protein [Actinomycetota bacterium]